MLDLTSHKLQPFNTKQTDKVLLLMKESVKFLNQFTVT